MKKALLTLLFITIYSILSYCKAEPPEAIVKSDDNIISLNSVQEEEILTLNISQRYNLSDFDSYYRITQPLKEKEFYKIQKGKYWGIYEANEGKIISEIIYDDIQRDTEKLCKVLKNGIWEPYDLINGKVYYDDKKPYNGDIYFISKNNLWGLYDTKNGEFVVGVYYDDIKPFSNQLYLVSNDGKLGLYNSRYHYGTIPTDYDDIKPFYQDFYLVSENNLWGIYSANPRGLMSDIIYDKIELIDSNKAKVYQNGNVRIYNFNDPATTNYIRENEIDTNIIVAVLNSEKIPANKKLKTIKTLHNYTTRLETRTDFLAVSCFMVGSFAIPVVFLGILGVKETINMPANIYAKHIANKAGILIKSYPLGSIEYQRK